MPYHRSLVNFLPFTGLVILLFFVFLGISLASYIIVKRYFPKLLTDTMPPTFAVISGAFAFLLGFTISLLWQNYTNANKLTLDEAVSFYVMIDSLLALDLVAQGKMILGLQNYLTVLKELEWPAMHLGRAIPDGWNAHHQLYEIMRSIKPTAEQASAYGNIFRLLDNIAVTRMARLQTVDPILGIGLHFVILAGAFFVLFSVAINRTGEIVSHYLSICIVCILLAFNIGLAVYLTYPFSGDIGIQGKALLEGIPSRLNKIQVDKKDVPAAPLQSEAKP